MNTKRILLSLATIVFVGGAVVGATGAFFDDQETSTGNVLAAGAIDLKVDNTSYYNHAVSTTTSWDLRDLTIEKFFNFLDLKPGDIGEDTISLHVNGNDSWLCADVKLTSNDDNGLTGPESQDGDTTDGPGQGELAQNVHFIWWADDGDNVLEDNETVLPGGPLGALAVGQTATVALADSHQNIWNATSSGTTTPLAGNSTRYIGKAWCFGTLTTAPLEQDGLGTSSPRTPANSTGGILCDGAPLNNITQSDSLTADVSFRAVQARHNDGFICSTPTSTEPTTGMLTVTKVVTGDTNATSGQFALFANGQLIFSGTATTVPAGVYTITEATSSPVFGSFNATFSGGCNASGSVSVLAGSSTSCTITNNFPPEI